MGTDARDSVVCGACHAGDVKRLARLGVNQSVVESLLLDLPLLNPLQRLGDLLGCRGDTGAGASQPGPPRPSGALPRG
jgi:hypothetical protein